MFVIKSYYKPFLLNKSCKRNKICADETADKREQDKN